MAKILPPDDNLSPRLIYELPVCTLTMSVIEPSPVVLRPIGKRLVHPDFGDAEGVYFSSMNAAITWVRASRPDLDNEHVYKDVTRWPTRYYQVFETQFMRALAVNNPSRNGPELVPSTLNEALDYFEANIVVY